MKKLIGFVAGLIVLISTAGCSSETVFLPSSEAENFIRDEFYEGMELWLLVDCPEELAGVSGSRFTCYMCPELYAAVEFGGGYFYGDGSTEFRCDAAFEGFAVDLVIKGTNYEIDMDSLRGATQAAGVD